jgi:hypothetical protein
MHTYICLIVFLAGSTWPSVDDERWRRHFFSSFFFFDCTIESFFLCYTLFTDVCVYKINIAECLPKENDPNYDDFFSLFLVFSCSTQQKDAFSFLWFG